MANLLSWLGDQTKRVAAQINPFDGGATYNNPHPQNNPSNQKTAQNIGRAVNFQPAARQPTLPTGRTLAPPPSIATQLGNLMTYQVPEAIVRAIPGVSTWYDQMNKLNEVQSKHPETQKAIQDKTAKVVKKIDSIPQLNLQLKTGNNIVDTVGNLGTGLINSTVNAPRQVATNWAHLNQDILSLPSSDPNLRASTPQQIGHLAGMLEGGFNAAAPFVGGSKAIDIAKEGAGVAPLGQKIANSIMEGAGTGLGFGATSGALQGAQERANSMKEQVNNVLREGGLQGTVGALAGGLIAPAGTIVGHGVGKVLNRGEGTIQSATDQAMTAKPKVSSKLPPKSVDVAPQPPSLVDTTAPLSPSTASKAASSGSKQRGFVKTVQNSEEVSPELATKVDATYDPFTDKAALAQTDKFLKQGIDKAHTQITTRLGEVGSGGEVGKQVISDGIGVMKKLDAAGRTEDAEAVFQQLAKKLTEGGQQSQAASLLAKRTPEGMLYGARKALDKAGVKMDDNIRASIQGALDAVKATASDSPERLRAVLKFQQEVQKHIPSSATDKAIGFWKAGLLTGGKTQSGNILSNSTFEGLHKLSNPLASALDYGLSLVTGERTKTSTLKGTLSGTGEGIKKGIGTLMTGFDERNATLAPKFEQGELNFKNKALGTYVNGIFRLMSTADQPFYYSSYRNNLNDLAKAEGLTKGLSGKALREYMAKTVKNPSEQLGKKAADDAAKSVLGYDTFLSNLATKLRTAADNAKTPVGKVTGKLAVNTLAPFTKVPSAFLSRTLDFTPVGAVKEAVTQMSRGKLDQRALVTALSEATTGSAIMYLGAELAKNGLLSGDYPTSPKDQQRWKAEGIQPNSVHLGGKWYSMNYFGPVGILFGIGKHVADSKQSGENIGGQTSQAIAGLGKSLLGQSFLQGLNNAVSAVNEPGRYATNVIRSQAGSVIPTLSNDIARAIDPNQRQVNGVADAIMSRIPGVREELMTSKDTLGNTLERSSSSVDQLINPFRPSNAKNTPLLTELDRLKATNPQNDIFPVPEKTLTANKETVKMTPEQADQYNTSVGTKIRTAWDQMIADPAYQALSDDKKANALKNAAQDIQSVEKAKTLQSMGRGDLAQKTVDEFKGSQLSMAQGNASLADYLDDRTTKASNPRKYYEQQVAKYNRDKANMSAIDRYKKELELSKMSITSKYSNEVQQLYSMSKANRDSLLQSNPDLNRFMPDVSRLSAELKTRKFTATDKISKAGKKGRKGSGKKAKVVNYAALARPANSSFKRLMGSSSKFKVPKVAKAKKTKAKVA